MIRMAKAMMPAMMKGKAAVNKEVLAIAESRLQLQPSVSQHTNLTSLITCHMSTTVWDYWNILGAYSACVCLNKILDVLNDSRVVAVLFLGVSLMMNCSSFQDPYRAPIYWGVHRIISVCSILKPSSIRGRRWASNFVRTLKYGVAASLIGLDFCTCYSQQEVIFYTLWWEHVKHFKHFTSSAARYNKMRRILWYSFIACTRKRLKTVFIGRKAIETVVKTKAVLDSYQLIIQQICFEVSLCSLLFNI